MNCESYDWKAYALGELDRPARVEAESHAASCAACRNEIATLRLTPVTDGERTFAEWTAEFDCPPEREAELVTNIGNGVFQGGFDALKRQFGG